MELKDIVCSLEHAKRLNELGVKQESLFYWSIDGEDPQIIMPMKIDNITVEISSKEKYSAFTASELGEMLPAMISTIRETDGHWSFVHGDNISIDMKSFPIYKEVDARAQLLIHLIENGLIEVPK
jgi:hypothetical protein